MKLNIFFITLMLILAGCVQKELKKDTINPETKQAEVENSGKNNQINSGWTGKDTYTVKIISENLDKAKAKAKHTILQDIVKIRMINESRYTDITKISKEFEKPLKNGRVVSEKKIDSGVEIYFQIKDEGLKDKFEKK